MSDYLVPRSSFTPGALTRASALEVMNFADQAAKATEIAKVASGEVAQVGAHAIGTTANLIVGAEKVRQQMICSGYSSPLYDDGQAMLLKITTQHVIALANAAQYEIVNQAASAMR